MPGFVPRPVLDRYFDRLLALLAARGIPAEFVAMPMNAATARAVLPEVRSAFAGYLAGYAARYPGFHVSGPVMPAWPDRYFGDGFSHLNPQGAALLSARFADCLEQSIRVAGTARGRSEAAPPPNPVPQEEGEACFSLSRHGSMAAAQ
jgi:hypothetical protein